MSNHIEKEVISIPASDSIPFIERHLVHACPAYPPYSSYKEARYMTFRERGGAMRALYVPVYKVVFNPYDGLDEDVVPVEYIEQIENYIDDRLREWDFGDCDFTFYVFSAKTVSLPHAPRPVRGIQGHCYYTEAELRSGKPEVEVESRSQSSTQPAEYRLPTIGELTSRRKSPALPASETTFAEWDEEFDPESVVDEREYVAKTICERQGQGEFRQMLLAAYDGRCAVTGYNTEQALEAAHIVRYRGKGSHHPANGLLLRSDIHTLFDKGLLAVDTNSMTVVLHPTLAERNSSYHFLQNKPLHLPTDPKWQPSKRALDYHRKEAKI